MRQPPRPEKSVSAAKMAAIFGVTSVTIGNWKKPDPNGTSIFTEVGITMRGRSTSAAYTCDHLLEAVEKLYFAAGSPTAAHAEALKVFLRLRDDETLSLPTPFKRDAVQRLEEFLRARAPSLVIPAPPVTPPSVSASPD